MTCSEPNRTNMTEAANESSPLVGPDREDDADIRYEANDNPVLHREDVSETKSSLHLFLLTLSIGGLQVVWSVELSSGTPYLQSLGMSKALLAFVWIASPLAGTLVQPYIGIRSDNCRISWGKRKPFMFAGAAGTIVALLALAWVQEIMGGLLGLFGADPNSGGVRTTIIIVATALMCCLDFAINTVQAGIRCFIVDNAPTHQQESANAWASRMTGVGNICGFIFGYIDLPNILPFLGKTRFQILCAIASLLLGITLLISCSYIKERDPRLDSPPASSSLGLVSFFEQVFKAIRHLPPQIAKVCEVQLAAWIGWFPFLYYATTYIGQLYVNPIFEDHPNLSDKDIDQAWEDATRIGSFALLIYAIVSFVANITLPVLVVPSYKPIVASDRQHREGLLEGEEESDIGARRMSASSIPYGAPLEQQPQGSKANKDGPAWLAYLQIPGFTLRRAWLISHVLFAACMFSTFFVYTHQAGSAVIGLLGISWAMTLWAPFALISAEVSRIDTEYRIRRVRAARTVAEGSRDAATTAADRHRYSHYDEDLENGHEVPHVKAPGEEDENPAQAGIVLGLHNVAVSAPQILSSLVCSAIFKTFQKPRGEPWDDSVGWVLRFGGVAALGAAYLTSRLTEGGR